MHLNDSPYYNQYKVVSVGGNDTYGITRIPTTVAGAQGCKKSRISSQHKERLPRFGPRGCVKP